MPGLITLLTDFGLADSYVAAMKGALLQRNPAATIVDITHTIPPQDIFLAAFTLGTAHPAFPEGTIHVVVVDPEVGTERRALLLRTPHAIFLAPDNGVLAFVLNTYGAIVTNVVPQQSPHGPPPTSEVATTTPLEAWEITNQNLFRTPVSHTFHGRDIFAPVAAALSKGLQPEEVGPRVKTVHTFALPHPRKDVRGNLIGTVLHVDQFGNLISNLRVTDIPQTSATFHIAGRDVGGLRATYAEGDELMAIEGSSGYIEVAARNGSAAQKLGVGRGTRLHVTGR